jgi:UDP-N-acetylglucosamine--N-acetylmuramyl-(pentapeptide) pyrophosphoryl-undecaprenol N-acetylglucosamine transferase
MLATAEILCESEVICVGTPGGLETHLVPDAGFELRLIDPVPLPRTLSSKLITLPFRLAKAVRQARAILLDTRAEVVVGFGGYACLPVYLAARRLRIPVVVHEANAVPGLANRIAARFAASVCVTFSNTGLPHQIVTGMPVRTAVATLDRAGQAASARAEFGLDAEAKVLLVSGGSQGARSLNEATVGALEALDAAGISVVHVTGKRNFDEDLDLHPMSQARYIRLPYVERMEQAYAAADVMVARSGAGTVTETAVVGLPVIFVPLPHGNGEQAKNAQGVVDAGAGILIADADLDSDCLAAVVVGLFSDPTALESMSKAAQGLMPRDSAERVAQQARKVRKEAQ